MGHAKILASEFKASPEMKDCQNSKTNHENALSCLLGKTVKSYMVFFIIIRFFHRE
jgi:hypothetical protein